MVQRKGQWIGIVLVVALVLLVGGLAVAQDGEEGGDGSLVIGPSERGVVFDTSSGDLLDPLQPGTYTPQANEQVTVYSIARQDYTLAGSEDDEAGSNDAIEARTRDGQEVTFDVTVIFSIDPEAVNQVHINWQERYPDSFIRPTVRNLVRTTAAEFSAEELLLSGGSLMQATLAEALTPVLEQEGFLLQSTLLTDIRLSPEFVEAVEARQQAELDLQRAEIEAQQAATDARAEREIALIEAETEAEILTILGERIAANPFLLYYLLITEADGEINITLPAFDLAP